MSRALSIDDLFPDEVDKPIEFDPYHGHCPELVLRSMRTPEEVVLNLKQMTYIRGLSLDDIAGKANLDSFVVADLIERGKGDMANLYKVCSALGIEPVFVPFPQMLKKGVVNA